MGSSTGIIILLISCFSGTVFGFFPNGRKDGVVTCPDPLVENGQHDSPFEFGFGFVQQWRHPLFTKLTFTCDEGFKLDGDKKSRCQLNGKWFPEIPKCISNDEVGAKALSCVLPPVGDHVDVHPRKASYGPDEMVVFACKGFRKSVGLKTTKCGDNGQFNPTPPKCIQPKCTPPQAPQNGAIRPSKNRYSVGDVVHFKCPSGFKLVGSTNTTCGEDGHFSSSNARCELIYCNKPVNPDGGKVESTKKYFTLGQKVKFSCNDLHYMLGSAEATCGRDGLFHPQNPTCHRSFIGYYKY